MKKVLLLILAVLLLAGCAQARQPEADVQQRHEAEREAGAPKSAAETEPPAVPETASVALSEDLAADFTVLDEAGNRVSLSDCFGKPIVVNFWATWCPPCRAELPDFDAAFAQYGEQVRFLMVDLTDGETDTVESATAFARSENSYVFPLYFDTEFSAMEAYSIDAIPTTLFIRADGSILYRQVGMLDAETLEGYIEQLLENT